MAIKTTGLISKLTPKYIRGLTCPDHLKQKYECIAPNIHLYISVSRAGTKSFCFRCKIDGNWRTFDLKCRFDDSQDDTLARHSINTAKSSATELQSRVNKRENPFDEAKTASKEPTLQELFEQYVKRHLSKNGRRVDETVKDFNRWFTKLATRKASGLTPLDAERFHGEIGKSRGKYAANRAIELGRAIFYKAKDLHLFFGENPFASVTLFDETPRNRFLSEIEAGRLLVALEEAPAEHCDHRTMRDIILLGLGIGVRKNNLFRMEWAELDLEAGLWTIPASKLKGKRQQQIKLTDTEIAILSERMVILKQAGIISPFVFPGIGKTGHITDIKRSWTTLRKRLGIEDVTVHDLRRSLAAAMASGNVNAALVKGVMAHADLKTTLAVYARTTQQAELEARQVAHTAWNAAKEAARQQANNIAQLPTADKQTAAKRTPKRATKK